MGADATMDGLLAHLVREAVVSVIRAELAPIKAKLETLAAASPPALVDVEVAAERLGLSPATVRRQAASGELPARRVGRRWKVDLAALRPVSTEQVEALAREARRG